MRKCRREKEYQVPVLHKSYIFPLYPMTNQKIFFEKNFGCCRFVYNTFLNEEINTYRTNGKGTHSSLKDLKKEYPFLKEVDSLGLCNSEINLSNAFSNFFKKRANFPKFKKKGKHNSYTTNAQYFKGKNGNTCCTINLIYNNNSDGSDSKYGYISLPKIGEIKTKFHQKINLENEKIKSATISRVGDKYYVAIMVEYVEDIVSKSKNEISLEDCLGLDYSSPHFAIGSNGIIYDSPKYYHKSQKKLARVQRNLSKKKKGSNNYRKQQNKLNKLSKHVSNQRKDFCEKLSNELTSKYSLICFEDINLKNMARSLKLGKNTNDNGFGMFRTMCERKAYKKSGYTIKIDKWYASTKTCNICGYKYNDIKLSTREWICPNCNTYHDRDDNAAKNIQKEGYRLFLAS